MNNAEAASKAVNSLRLLNKDEHVSRRYVLRLLRDRAQNLISQKLLDRTLAYETNLYTEIKCFNFEKIDVVKCDIVEFRTCKILMRSIEPLPKLIFSRLGASIKEVTSIDGSVELVKIDAQQYRRNQKRSQKIDGEVYVYLGSDNHLYIPEEEIYVVALKVLTTETEDCKECECDECKNNWESPFICPDKLEDVVFKDVLQILTATYRVIIPDQNPNGIEKQ